MDRQQLEHVLRMVDGSVRLVHERQLRRALMRLTDDGERVAHGLDHAHRLTRERLLHTGVLPPEVTDGDGDTRLLLVEPGDRGAEKLADADLLRVYWELIFEATVVDRLRATGAERWAELGEVGTTEAQFRLHRGQVLPPDATPAEQYAAFVAEYVTLRRFAPGVLEFTYPSLKGEVVERLVSKDLNADELLSLTRPAGACDPIQAEFVKQVPDETVSVPAAPQHLHARATKAAATGNLVRSALLRQRAGDPAAVAALSEGLIPKLGKFFAWDEGERTAWADALVALLPTAARWYWSPAAMGLYDLQKVPVDLTKELYAIDPADWVRGFFRRPLVRKLTLARHSVLLRHLLAARKHFARLPSALANPVLTLLEKEIATADAELREKLRPVVTAALSTALSPSHVPEVVARETVAEELIDTICHRGHARLGDLRDAVARHALKLDDWKFQELFTGDALLRADTALGRVLDGLYHPGEVYLRAIQRGSSLAFGTSVGRWLTKFVLIPVGGAVMTVEFGKYLWHELGIVYKFLTDLVGDDDPSPAHPKDKGHGELFTTPDLTAMAILALLFLLLLHVPAVRALFGKLLGHVWKGLKAVFVTAPLWVWNSPPVKAVRTHPVPRFVADRLGWPLVAGVLVGSMLWLFRASWLKVFGWGGGTFLALALVFNTPFGRSWQSRIEELFSDWWRAIRRDLLPNLIGFVAWLFREALNFIDRVIYSVDEWLRFREGQSQPVRAGKIVLAFLWFPVAYLWRFVLYLFIEPQVNPVKHFPVVTVSHKLLFPMIPALADITRLGIPTMTTITSLIPGIFGFIVWELKENWRLYAANRPSRLRPLPIGHHGETVYGLLTPGFHSGTVPAAFEKARSALARERLTGRPTKKVRKALDELHHAEEAVRKLIDRELLALPRSSKAWAGLSASTGAVHLGLQRFTAEVVFAGREDHPVVIEFARRDRQIVGRVLTRGALDRLGMEQLAVWNTAMRGLLAKGAAGDGPAWSEWVTFWNQQAV